MSHFYTMVLIPNTLDVESVVEYLMAPYSENLMVNAHKEICWCVEHSAGDKAREIADQEFGSIDSLRDEFRRTFTKSVNGSEDDNLWEEQEAWSKFSRPRVRREEDLSRELLKETKPDPSCEDCGGRGFYYTHSNPKSKWDWYQIGGRWSGILDNYNPTEDPLNQEPCGYCRATGIRMDLASKEELEVQDGLTTFQIAEAFTEFYKVIKKIEKASPEEATLLRAEAESIATNIGGRTCNACGGTRIYTRNATQWTPHSGDVMPVRDLLAMSKEELNERVGGVFAVVTPDGEWHERGEMGWFNIVSGEVDREDWKEAVRVLLRLNDDCYAVVVDCHI